MTQFEELDIIAVPRLPYHFQPSLSFYEAAMQSIKGYLEDIYDV